MKLIRQNTYQSMRWQNGLGTTREIAKVDVGEELLWRISLAQVNADGPFSKFPNCDRILTVVKGAGMRLSNGADCLTATPLDPVRFSGQDDIIGDCIDGPVENLNLIYNAQVITAKALFLTCTGRTLDVHRLGDFSTGWGIIHFLDGEVITAESETPKAGDTLILDPSESLPSLTGHFRCVALTLNRC